MVPSSNRGLRVFVVENHPDTLNYLRLYLEDSGHQVQSAGSIEETLREWPHATVDVLICDIGLPDGDGWDLLSRLHSGVFAIAMSGFGMGADRSRSKRAGFRDHLTKPFPLKRLDELLGQALDEREARDAGPAGYSSTSGGGYNPPPQ